MVGAQILIVDDDPWIVRMVTTVLEKRGHVIHSAADGEEGLQKAAKLHPDLVITDVMMPKMDGWTLVRTLRTRPELALTPVIFLTALGGDEERIRGFRQGADVIYQMLGWTDGRFDFTAVEVEMEDEIRTQTMHLLMEGARRMDEARAASG